MPKKKKQLRKKLLSFLLIAAIMIAAAGNNPAAGSMPGRVTADAAAKTRVVVLDPGHGGREKGACYFGLQEKTLNLKIAYYCASELQKYPNVKVVMTRMTDRLVSKNGYSADLLARSLVAKRNKASIFVCLHNNAYGPGENGATNGVRVYHQNNSFYASVGAQSKKLAQILARRIASCGLGNGGARTRYSDDRSRRDPGGKKGDYYAVLYYNKTYRIPAVIVEHAFMSNKRDAANLKNEAFLKRLGMADAAGIAEYLGLTKTGKHRSGWYRASGKTYYYDRNGYLMTAWQTIGGKRYYFSVKDGHMLTGRQRIGGKIYTFTKDGVLKK